MDGRRVLLTVCGFALALTFTAANAQAQRYHRYPARVYSTHVYSGFYWGPWYPYGPYPYPYWYGPWWPRPYHYVYDDSGAARLQVSPRQTQVYVDGYFVGVVDDFDGTFQRLRLPPGGHEIVLRLEGHRNATHRLYFQPRTTITVRHAMEPLPPGAPADPIPKPDPSAVREPYPPRERTGEPAGEPNDLPEAPRSPEGADRPRTPVPGGERATGARFGAVAVHVTPRDAEVIVNGSPWRGPADADGAIVIHLPQGTHRVEVRRQGFVTFVTDVEVRAGETTALRAELKTRN